VTFVWDARDFRSQTRPAELLFRSRLDNGPWTPSTCVRSREFRGLSLGTHSFEVEVRDLDGNRNREELVHRFEVGESLVLRSLWAVGGALAAGILLALGSYIYLRRARSLRRSSRYSDLFRGFPGPVFILDGEGRVLDYNERSPEVLGVKDAQRQDLLGRPVHWLPLLSSDEARSGLKAVLEGKDFQWEGSFGERCLEVRGFPFRGKAGVDRGPGEKAPGAVLMVQDSTARAEEQSLRERDRRLSSLRQFAERVVASLGEALREPVPDELLRSRPGLLERRRHAESMLRRLSLFSGGKKGEVQAAIGVGSILERILGEAGDGAAPGEKFRPHGNVRIDYRWQEGLRSVRIDASLLVEAVLEVLRNSADAMPERGTLTVRARNVRLEDDPGALQSGPYVEILVKDTGMGMDPVQLEHILEPFHSTRPRDGALGMGLSIAHGIVRSSGGDLRLESRPGQGTTVRILLPAEG
jgi:signal transduction histidine kinase